MHPSLTRPASAAVLVLTLGLGLAACGGDDSGSAENRDRATQATPTPDASDAADSPSARTSPGSDDDQLDDSDLDDDRLDDSDLDDDGGGDGDNLTGGTLERAVEAALTETGGGRVTDAENADRDEGHAYEVEVELDGAGDDVSVELDEQFAVVRVDR